MRLDFNPLVAEDIAAATAWYRQIEVKLESDLLSDLRLAFARIAENPAQFHFDPDRMAAFQYEKVSLSYPFQGKGGLRAGDGRSQQPAVTRLRHPKKMTLTA